MFVSAKRPDRPIRPLAPLLLIPLVALLAGCPREKPPERRALAGAAKGWNVLLLSVDTLRADRMGAYGYRPQRPGPENSPRMDRLIGEGVRFDGADAQRAATWPSLATVLSGLYPSGHGVLENGYGFPDGLPTLPIELKGSGYRTGAFLSNMCKANHQGWDDFACTGGEDGKTVQRAIDWGRSREGKQPFLLWVHLFGAHGPYYNGGDLAARVLDPGYEGPLGTKRWQLDRVHLEKLALSPRDLTHLDAIYDAAVIGSDRHVGNLLDGLRAAGKLDRTLIVLLADHGEELYGHNRYLYHSCSVYQDALHVPFAIVAPGLVPAGASVPQRVELADVTPTIYALLGIAPPAEHGRSLVPYLERPGAGGAGKPAFSEYGLGPIRTIHEGRFKLIWNPQEYQPVCIPKAPPGHYPIAPAELYDLEKDPGERTNLALGDPNRVRELARHLDQRFAGLPGTGKAKKQEISPEQRKKLEALGYAVP
ncbi:MAG TPA: sulfatase [Thermoanaerobaculia bacterium]|nr:sulfatase [Thermoanaerobaculia bacterium]